jgi:hypothetical protein
MEISVYTYVTYVHIYIYIYIYIYISMDLKFRISIECGIDKIHNVAISIFQSTIQLNIPSSPYIYKQTHTIDITVFIIHIYIYKNL